MCPHLQHFIQGKLTEECVEAVLEERGRLEDLEGAIVILTHFEFASFARGEPEDGVYAPDIYVVVSSLRILGGMDNRLFGEPCGVGEQRDIMAALAALSLTQRCARAPFIPSIKAPLTYARFKALRLEAAEGGEPATLVTNDGTLLAVCVPNHASALSADRSVCVPISAHQMAALDAMPFGGHPPRTVSRGDDIVGMVDDSNSGEAWRADPSSAPSADLSQLRGPAGFPWCVQDAGEGGSASDGLSDLEVESARGDRLGMAGADVHITLHTDADTHNATYEWPAGEEGEGGDIGPSQFVATQPEDDTPPPPPPPPSTLVSQAGDMMHTRAAPPTALPSLPPPPPPLPPSTLISQAATMTHTHTELPATLPSSNDSEPPWPVRVAPLQHPQREHTLEDDVIPAPLPTLPLIHPHTQPQVHTQPHGHTPSTGESSQRVQLAQGGPSPDEPAASGAVFAVATQSVSPEAHVDSAVDVDVGVGVAVVVTQAHTQAGDGVGVTPPSPTVTQLFGSAPVPAPAPAARRRVCIIRPSPQGLAQQTAAILASL
ncbi:MAG: hypothetical protein P4L40_19390 [Terracidiphilus sp.]|nr:hypothetical protein [Terracidiphilus sp.]